MHLHRYEKIWLTFGILSLIIFLSIVGVTAFAHGHTPAGGLETIDPEKVDSTPPFNEPGVRKINDNTYEVIMIAETFGYKPSSDIKVPAGKNIIFTLTSRDVVHSFSIHDTKVNMMVVPGRITSKQYKFTKPGKYMVICNEYCGTGHHFMQTEIEVYEP